MRSDASDKARVEFGKTVGEGGERRLGVARGAVEARYCVCVYYCSTYYKVVRVGGEG